MEDTNHHLENEETAVTSNGNNHGWQKVTYAKRRKNQQQNQNKAKSATALAAGASDGKDGNVFRAIEQQSEDRHRRIVETKKLASIAETAPKKIRSRRDDDSDESESDEEREIGPVIDRKDDRTEKKKKKKSEKKPKVTVPEAASKIDASDLAAFLADVSGSYDSHEDIQLMRFADFFARAFAGVGAAQFPWVKLFRESPVAKLGDIPLSHLPETVYRTSVDWINQRSVPALHSFALLILDSILSDLSSQLVGGKNSKKATQQTSSKSQVALFVVLAIVLRRKPDVLVSLLPTLKENSKYQGQDKLPVIIWMICQACQGDLAVGLYAWAHNLLPLLNNKSSNNPLTRDLILQLIERISAAPKARSILVNGAVRKGERLIPPPQLEVLLRVTFPLSSSRVKATERFEAVYPLLKEVFLAGAPGSKAMKQVSQQIFGIAVAAAGEANPELSKEAVSIAYWCLSQNSEIYKHWDKLYSDNLDASVAILKKLSEELKEQHFDQSCIEHLKQSIKSFHQKNEIALGGENSAQHGFYSDADKYCKLIMRRLSRSHGCLKGFALVAVVLGVSAAVMSSNGESFDWKRVSLMLDSFKSV